MLMLDFQPSCSLKQAPDPQSVYRRHERVKKSAYEERIREVEHATFSPPVLSTTGGLAREATTFYKRLASLLAAKWEEPCNTVCVVIFPSLFYAPQSNLFGEPDRLVDMPSESPR